MIALLHGVLVDRCALYLVLKVRGVGYQIEVGDNAFSLPMVAIGQRLLIYTHQIIRENEQTLYGFATAEARDWFRHLIKLNGVGPKLALKIITHLEPRQLVQAIRQRDLVRLTRVPGLGKKTAERLVVDMEKQAKAYQPTDIEPMEDHTVNEAVQALIVLGYSPSEALNMVHTLPVTEQKASTAELVRFALQRVQHA